MKTPPILTLAVLLAVRAFAADGSAAAVTPTEGTAKTSIPFSIGLGVKVSTLGVGGDLAFPLTRRTNARIGMSAFRYSHVFRDVDAVDYKGKLTMLSGHAQIDIYPFGGQFHVSPGVMFYNGNHFRATGFVDPEIGFNTRQRRPGPRPDTPPPPIFAEARVDMRKFNPMFTVGRGNLLPRSLGEKRHFVFGFEAGVIYQGAPRFRLNVSGNACDEDGCRDVHTFKEFHEDTTREQAKLNKKLSVFKLYPVISTSFGYRF